MKDKKAHHFYSTGGTSAAGGFSGGPVCTGISTVNVDPRFTSDLTVISPQP